MSAGGTAPVRDRAGRVATVAAVIAGLLMLAIQVVATVLVTPEAPLGLVSLQLAADPVRAAAIVGSWTGAVRTAALRAHGLDLLLPCAYGVATVAAGRALAVGRAAGTPWARRARRAGLAGGAAAVADQVENGAIAVTLLVGARPGAAALTVGFAAVKWVLLGTSVAGLALARWCVRA